MENVIDKIKPFSLKQQKVFQWWTPSSIYKDYDNIVADGAVRSGKTMSMSLSFVMWANETFNNKSFALCGRTISSLLTNVVEPLIPMLQKRGYTVLHNQTRNKLIISNRNIHGKKVRNTFLMYSGKDEASASRIQGLTASGIFFDEVALMPTSFVRQACVRCSVSGSKKWFNCNPESPKHPFKIEYIDNVDNSKLVYHLHFTMDDNLSLSEQKKAEFRSGFKGLFYDRYILGKWAIAEGVIYPMFLEEKHVIKDPFTMEQAERLFVSCDYGIQNATTFGLYGVYRGHYHLFSSFYHSGRETGELKTDKFYVDELIKFIGFTKIEYITIDPSAASFIEELRIRKFTQHGRRVKIYPAKNAVLKGIQIVAKKLDEGMFTLDPSNVHDIKEFSLYMWDEKASDRGLDEPSKTDDHCQDRNRYAIRTDMVLHHTTVNISGRGSRGRTMTSKL